MAVYYNDHDPQVCAWLRELVRTGSLPNGKVDERSILEVRPEDLKEFTSCHFFAGIGGWPYALRLAGWPDDRPVWTGSPPCQPFSVAGKRGGYDDDRHLAPAWLALIRECHPAIVFGEQVASAAGREWLCDLRAEMETMGYAVGAADLCAASVNAPHIRQRLWFGATDTERDEGYEEEPRRRAFGRMGRVVKPVPWNRPWQGALSEFRTLDDGLPRSVVATDGARNAIVPLLAAEFVGAFAEAAACGPARSTDG
jgi:DNA (cytosine-5)-methyltransferase 1